MKWIEVSAPRPPPSKIPPGHLGGIGPPTDPKAPGLPTQLVQVALTVRDLLKDIEMALLHTKVCVKLKLFNFPHTS